MRALYLVDAMALVFRGYHAIPSLKTSDGTPAGGAYGFLQTLLKLIQERQPDHLAAAFDADPIRSFRNRVYPAYKANRAEPPEDLTPQFDLSLRLARAVGVPSFRLADFEADDLIATLAFRFGGQLPIVIVTQDKDLAQLVRPGITLLEPYRGEELDEPGVKARFGVRPIQIPDYLALVGDPVDNIPGVSEVGRKTAAHLLFRFSDVEEILRNIEAVRRLPLRGAEALADRLGQAAGQIRLARFLATVQPAPIETSLNQLYYRGAPPGQAKAFLEALGFKGLLSRLPGPRTPARPGKTRGKRRPPASG